MDYSSLSQLLSQMDPESQRALIDATLADDRAGLAAKAMRSFEADRNMPAPAGMVVGKQGVFVASSPLEHLAHAMRVAQGARGADEMQARIEKLIGSKGTGLEAMMRVAGGMGPPAGYEMGAAPPMSVTNRPQSRSWLEDT